MSNLQSTPAKNFEIAICGAGPVGLTLATLLVQRGVAAEKIVLIDGKTLEQSSQDPRSIALSYGSRQILEQVGAWPIIANTATAISHIHISRQGHFGRTLIDCGQHNVPVLGYVTRYGALITALSAASHAAGIAVLRPTKLTSSQEQADYVELQLEDGSTLHANILVQAEGGVFGNQVTKSLQRDYQQTAIVAHVRANTPIAHRAFERFTDEGPLALLPQDEGYALVWCVKPATASRLLTLSDAKFLQALKQAFGARLGSFTQTTQRHAYPLGLNADPTAPTGRTIAIGNAAQTLHPVAGQGLNLGLRDATVLARLLAQATTPTMLQQYHAKRALDRRLTCNLTDVMARIFINHQKEPSFVPTQALLGISLGMMDVLHPAKHLLAELMMFGRR